MLKVVIVEDEDLIRKGLIYTFDWIKYDCVVVGEAVNGIEGKSVILDLKPDIVVTDIKMPFMDGLELIAELKGTNIEFVIITGHAEFEYAREAITYGVNNYLLKPVDHNELEKVINKLADKIKEKSIIALIQDRIKDLKDYEILDIAYYCSKSNYKYNYTIDAISYITKFYDSKLTAEEVADYLLISKTLFGKAFKEDTQLTFNDFLNKYRIQMALKLMFKSDMKIYEIAEKVGYSEYKYFSRVFKKYMDHTPTEFMNIDTYFAP